MRMNEIALTRVRYGFWRIFTLLRREGFKDNHKRIYRLYRQEGLNLRSKRHRRWRSEQHREKYAQANQINQCLSMDFVSDQLYNGQRFRALTIIDNYSRRTVFVHRIGQSLKGCDVVNTLESLYEHYGIKLERIMVDNGPEFVSKKLDKWAYERKVTLDFSRRGKPADNPFIESFNGSFRDECLNTNWFLSLHDARLKIASRRRDYNAFRLHSSLQGLTPEQAEYEMLNYKENSNLALSS
ncbi:MAG: IS3 family transposase [Paludibacter sp.]|nr:IS3 family transposase [Paludibacter sp.]MDD4198393.1 IS3 family transposase [Paludibacter sp.]MDD4427071.1 IS3 family transposase [Paludibacter sp.]